MPTGLEPDPYKLLGVAETAPDEVINAAWRVLVKQCHPDNATSEADRQARAARSVALNQARDTLLDADLRAQVNRERLERARDAARRAGGAERGKEQAIPPNEHTAPGDDARQRRASSQAPLATQSEGQALLGWFLHSRTGQWIAVVIAVALMVPLMTLAGWPPVIAAVAAALLAGVLISSYKRQVRGSPLGDMLAAAKFAYSFVIELIRGFGDVWR
ncbi:MAG: J domain-containing protein [Candidatus Limnocylindrales bacterium]